MTAAVDGWMTAAVDGWMTAAVDGWMTAAVDGWMTATLDGWMPAALGGWIAGLGRRCKVKLVAWPACLRMMPGTHTAQLVALHAPPPVGTLIEQLAQHAAQTVLARAVQLHRLLVRARRYLTLFRARCLATSRRTIVQLRTREQNGLGWHSIPPRSAGLLRKVSEQVWP